MFESGIRITREFGESDLKVVRYLTELPSAEAEIALKILEHGGLSALGEPGAVVNRAFALAKCAVKLMVEHNMVVHIPDLNQINQERDERLKISQPTKTPLE